MSLEIKDFIAFSLEEHLKTPSVFVAIVSFDPTTSGWSDQSVTRGFECCTGLVSHHKSF